MCVPQTWWRAKKRKRVRVSISAIYAGVPEFHQQIARQMCRASTTTIINPAGEPGRSGFSLVEKPIQLLTDGRHKVIHTDFPLLKKIQ